MTTFNDQEDDDQQHDDHERDDRDHDDRSVDELVEFALNEPDDDLAWDAAAELQRRGTVEVLARVRLLCGSEWALERQLGADVLGQFGTPERTFPQESAELLFSMLETEHDEDVLRAILVALSHNAFAGTVEAAVELAEHYDTDVRQAVVLALTGRDDRRAVEQLLTMMSDVDAEVRGWATFGIGRQSEVDGPEILAALADRLDDSDDETRWEALVGLTRRKDQRGFAALRELLANDPTDWVVDAAKQTELPEFATLLLALRGKSCLRASALEDAIIACSYRVGELN